MKLVIAGGDGYEFDSHDYAVLDELARRYDVERVVVSESGGIAAKCGAYWAKQNHIPVSMIPPLSPAKDGKINADRLRDMVQACTACIVFPGPGEARKIAEEAIKWELAMYDYR